VLNGARLSPLAPVAVAAVPAGATAGGDGTPAATGSGRFAAALERAQEAADESARDPRPGGPSAPLRPDGRTLGPARATVPRAPPRPALIGPDTAMSAQAESRATAADRDERRTDEAGTVAAEGLSFAAAGEALQGPCAWPVAGEPTVTTAVAVCTVPSLRRGAADAASRDGESPVVQPAPSSRPLEAGQAAHDATAGAQARDGPSSTPAGGATARDDGVPTTTTPGATAAGAGAESGAGAAPVAGGTPATPEQPALPPALGAPAATPAATPAPPPGTEPARPGWHESRLAAAVDTAQFAPELGARLSVLVRDGVQQARLHLNPAEMGPIAVQISLDGTAARVEMVAEHALTRQLLEQAMPVLASALREGGLTLAGGGVFEQPRRPSEGAERERGHAPQGLDAQAGEAPAAMAMPARRLLGALDVYA
jgi:flagellar hook-length control protein FliK